MEAYGIAGKGTIPKDGCARHFLNTFPRRQVVFMHAPSRCGDGSDDAAVASSLLTSNLAERTTMKPLNTWCLAIAALGVLALQPDVARGVSESSKDETLESKVEQRLRMEGRIRWDELKVEANQGEVTLYGIVKSNEERGFAEKAASTVTGVSSIVNKLIVQPGMPDPGHAPNARINEESRDRVIEGPPGLKDRQVMP